MGVVAVSPRLGEGADSDGLPVSDWCLKGPNLRVSCQVKTPPFWPAADISLDQPRRLVRVARSMPAGAETLLGRTGS